MAKILVVDDEPEICDLLERFLAKRGYDVTTATRGSEACEKIKEERPHLMLLDIRMPGMDGFQVLKEAKTLDPELGIIVVTALHDEGVAKEAIGAGAYDYITKPIDFSYLESCVMMKIADVQG